MEVALILVAFCAPIHADITWTDDVYPADPTTWTSDTWASVGGTANGTLTVDGDGDLLSFLTTIGSSPGSSGRITVAGTGSTWTNSHTITIGLSGAGELAIIEGGSVNSSFYSRYSSYDYIGYQPGSNGTVTVDGVGSTWRNNGGLMVGYGGDGSLTVKSGGKLISTGATIGSSAGATGHVTIDGVDSTWTNSGFTVGWDGDGSLEIINGGEVTTGYTWVERNVGSRGVIDFDNGTLSTGGLVCSISDLTGTGTINTHALLSDLDSGV